MSSPDRLSKLLQQRALVSQHLSWLDAEIAAVSSPGAISGPPTTQIEAAPPPPRPAEPIPLENPPEPAPESLTEANSRADEIIERYRATEALNPAETKRSCLLLMAATFLLGTAILLGVYLLHYR